MTTGTGAPAPQAGVAFDTWLWRLRPEVAHARATLVILPHAGGSAQAYASWSQWLPKQLNAFVAQYPGRGARFAEPSADRIEDLADALARVVAEIDGPVIVFGHSLGGLVGFETAWSLQERGRPLAGFFASASTPPQLFRLAEVAAAPLSDEQLLQQLQQRGGLPTDVLEHPDLLEMIFEVLRADIRILDNYAMTRRSRRLDCPMTAIGGADDPVTTPDKLVEWQARATQPIELHLLPGGHFYIDTQTVALGRILAENVERWTAHPQVDASTVVA